MPETASQARFWDKTARKYAATAIADTEGYERTLARTAELLPSTSRVLEIGCGTGTTALRLAPGVSNYLATDVSPEMIAIGREKAAEAGLLQPFFEVASPEDLAEDSGPFDAILAFNLLHLIRERAETLARLYGFLKPGGLFISKTPCLGDMNPFVSTALRLAVPAMQLVGKAPPVFFFTSATLERDIEAAGFQIVERERHGSEKNDIRLYLVARKT